MGVLLKDLTLKMGMFNVNMRINELLLPKEIGHGYIYISASCYFSLPKSWLLTFFGELFDTVILLQ